MILSSDSMRPIKEDEKGQPEAVHGRHPAAHLARPEDQLEPASSLQFALHAQPGGLWQVFERLIQELPHALPLRQILQQAAV